MKMISLQVPAETALVAVDHLLDGEVDGGATTSAAPVLAVVLLPVMMIGTQALMIGVQTRLIRGLQTTTPDPQLLETAAVVVVAAMMILSRVQVAVIRVPAKMIRVLAKMICLPALRTVGAGTALINGRKPRLQALQLLLADVVQMQGHLGIATGQALLDLVVATKLGLTRRLLDRQSTFRLRNVVTKSKL